MSKRLRVNLIKYGSCGMFVAVMAWLYVSFRAFEQESLMEQYRILCDAFTIPGILLLMGGCLLALTNAGALDGLLYAVTFAFRSLIPGGRWNRDEKYADYVERRRENKVKGYGFLFISGGVTMALALVFMFLFYQLY